VILTDSEQDWLLNLIVVSSYICTFGRSPSDDEVRERIKLIKAREHLSNTQEGEQLELFEGENNAT